MLVRSFLRKLRAVLDKDSAATLTVWLLFSQLMAAGVSFVVNIIAAYGLDPTQRGLLAFYLQLGYLLTTVTLLGTEKPFLATIRGAFPATVAFFFRVLRPSYWVIAAVAALAGLAFVLQWEAVAIPLALMSVFILCNQHLRIIRAAYIASGSLRPFLTVIITTNLLTLGFAVVLAAVGNGNFLVWLLAYVVANVVATFLVGHASFTARYEELVTGGPVSEVRRQGRRLLPASLGNIAMFRPDRLLLPILASPSDLGVYIVVSAALEVAVWPVQQWSDSKMHDWQQSRPDKDRRQRWILLLKAALGVTAISVVCAVFVAGVVIWILPDTYLTSLTLILPIMAANILFGTSRAQQAVAIAANRGGLVSVAEVSGLVVSIVAYLFLIPMFGGLGAALGSVLGNAVCFAVTELGQTRPR